MKTILFFILLFNCSDSFAQTYTYDRQGNLIGGSHIRLKEGVGYSLKDSLTGNRFILDSSHIYITAYNKAGKELWKTDPYKDSKIEEYRVSRPVIVNFEFITSHWCYGDKLKKTIWINYNNTQAGYIDLNSGKFHFCGQD